MLLLIVYLCASLNSYLVLSLTPILTPNLPPNIDIIVSNTSDSLLTDDSYGAPPQSSTPSNPPALKDAEHICDSDPYGTPRLSSCRQALANIPSTTRVLTFGKRPAGPGKDVTIPYRFVGLDGDCVIEIRLLNAASSERISSLDIKNAAESLIDDCVEGHRIGGSATGLGERQQLVIDVLEYDPTTECEATRTPANKDHCALQGMPADETPQLFGKRGTPGIDVGLPIMNTDPTKQCGTLIVLHHGTTIMTSWYDIWSAAVSNVGMCVSQGKNGNSVIRVANSALVVDTRDRRNMALSGNHTAWLDTD